MVYFATDGDNGLLKAEVKDQVMSGLTGWSSGTGSFNVKFIGEATNRDGDSYRSPWTGKYDPPLDDG